MSGPQPKNQFNGKEHGKGVFRDEQPVTVVISNLANA